MKKFLSMALALAMTLSLVVVGASAKSFTDKDKINYKEAVAVVNGVKIIDGYTDGSFNPTATLTRGAAAKIICNMVLGPTTAAALGVSTAPFKDVSVKNVFAGYIAYCAQQGIINGYADKTFRPAGTVTGYQFLKMLLGALGYDGKIEGFSGTNWEVNVAKLATNLKLYSGNSKFVGGNAMTREEACLYAYNTLTATMVEYQTKGSSIVINGVTINQGASKANKVANLKANDYRGATDGDEYMQFCEQFFSGLKYSSVTDAFQTPAEKWKNGSTTIGTFNYDADQTYTAPVTVGKIYTDLGLSAAPKTLNVYVDGKAVTAPAAITKGGDATYGGNGAKTMVYVNDSAKTNITIVIVNTYVGKVSGVTAATAAKDRYVTVNALSTPAAATYTFETDKFAAKDLVSFTAAWDGTSAYEIQDMNALTKTATGKLTAYTGTDATKAASNFTAGDKTYSYNCKGVVFNTAVSNISSFNVNSSDLDVYCDANGYALYVEGTQGVTNYATVIGVGSNNAYGSATSGVTLLLADGTTKEVTAKMANSADLSSTLTPGNSVSEKRGDLVTYTVDTKGVYLLTVANKYNETTTSLNSTTFTNGKSAIVLGNHTGLYTTSNTVFFVCTNGANGAMVYNVYTGYAKMPSILLSAGSSTVTGVAYKTNATYTNQVDAVYISVPAVNGISDVNTYVLKQTSAKDAIVTDGTGSYYNLPAIVDGKVTTAKVSTTTYANLTDNTVTALGSVVKTSDIISATPVTAYAYGDDTTGYYVGTGIVAANGSVIGVGATAAAAQYFAYNDKTAVYTVDGTRTAIKASDVASVLTKADVTVYFTMDTTSGATQKVIKDIIIVDPLTVPAPAPTPVNGTYATGVDKTVNGASALLDLSKPANAAVSPSNVLTFNALKSADEIQQMKDALTTLGYTVGKITRSTDTYTITATKSGVENTITCNATTGITPIYTVTVDGTKNYVKGGNFTVTTPATNPGTGYVVGTTYAAYATPYNVTADTTITTGYVKVNVTAAVVATGLTDAMDKSSTVTAALKDGAADYVKAGSAASVVVTATSTAAANAAKGIGFSAANVAGAAVTATGTIVKSATTGDVTLALSAAQTAADITLTLTAIDVA